MLSLLLFRAAAAPPPPLKTVSVFLFCHGYRYRHCHRYEFESKVTTEYVQVLVDSKKVNAFAQSNTALAHNALRIPSPVHLEDPNNTRQESSTSSSLLSSSLTSTLLQHYLKFRNWKTEYITNDMTCTLLSHAMTFPLTLAYYLNLNHLNETPSITCTSSKSSSSSTLSKTIERKITKKKKKKKKGITLRLCCVGSRAEASLPDDYWREFLIGSNYFCAVNNNNSNNDHNNDCSQQQQQQQHPVEVHWIIDFIGPESSSLSPPQMTKSRFITLPSNDSNSNCAGSYIQHTSLTLQYHSKYLHTHIMDLLLVQKRKNKSKQVDDNDNKDENDEYDFYVCFNPGMGHPNLKQMWEPSIKYILKTNKPLLLTAHSYRDSIRDKNVLVKQLKLLFNNNIKLDYSINPFGSRMAYVDPVPITATTTSILTHNNDNNDNHRNNNITTRRHIISPNYLALLYHP